MIGVGDVFSYRRYAVEERGETAPPACPGSPPAAGALPAVRRAGLAAAEVTIVRRVQPPSQPPPAGGRRRVPAP